MTRKKPTVLDRKKGLYLKETATKGRGVFCTSAIKKGETLEVTPALILNERETGHTDKTLLNNYAFTVGPLPKAIRAKAGVKDDGNASCLIMGLMTFCNHDEEPNAEIVWEQIDGTVYHTLQATRSIPKNTEICTTYGEGWFEDRQ
ncbi:MAG: SET domain-containing protein-lysine N-methyltransferase [Micavibrio sp.]|nr:SET domain-containing protein-lysine N-methyltransferase [Micavibrio sp.]